MAFPHPATIAALFSEWAGLTGQGSKVDQGFLLVLLTSLNDSVMWTSFFLIKNHFLIYVCVCVCVSECHTCMGAFKGQKTVLDSPGTGANSARK